MTGQAISALCGLTDKRPLRALTLAGWWQGVLIVWAVCVGVVHGTGFRPRRLRWRLVFLPLPAMLVMIVALLYRFA